MIVSFAFAFVQKGSASVIIKSSKIFEIIYICFYSVQSTNGMCVLYAPSCSNLRLNLTIVLSAKGIREAWFAVQGMLAAVQDCLDGRNFMFLLHVLDTASDVSVQQPPARCPVVALVNAFDLD